MITNATDAIAAYQRTFDDDATGEVARRKKTDGKGGTGDAGSFGGMLQTFIGDTIGGIKAAEQATAAGVVGKSNLQEVVLAVSQAEVMVQTVSSIRDKVIAAYQDIIRMPI